MDHRQYIKASGAAVTGSALGGRAASGPGDTGDSTSDGAGTKEASDGDRSDGWETGTLATSVTDQPVDIGDFESCVITIDGLWVKPTTWGPMTGRKTAVRSRRRSPRHR